MKRVGKVIGWILLFTFIVIQFFHPKKNIHSGDQPNALAKHHPPPADVNAILKKACNDCHSNNTVYPWYSKLQPVDWWLDGHIRDGKRGFNLDELGARPAWLRYRKMEEFKEQIEEGKMPLNSYTWIHKDAILTADEKEKLTHWAQDIMDEMKQTLPADSLKRPQRPKTPKA